MRIIRIDNNKNIDQETNRIEIFHDGEKYTITPEFSGIRIHKHSLDDYINVRPAVMNEIILK